MRRRLELKSKVRHCILNGIKELADCAKNVSVGKEMDVRPSSQSYMQDQPNNLGLIQPMLIKTINVLTGNKWRHDLKV